MTTLSSKTKKETNPNRSLDDMAASIRCVLHERGVMQKLRIIAEYGPYSKITKLAQEIECIVDPEKNCTGPLTNDETVLTTQRLVSALNNIATPPENRLMLRESDSKFGPFSEAMNKDEGDYTLQDHRRLACELLAKLKPYVPQPTHRSR